MLRKVGEELFPGCADFDQAEYWAGLRPMTPTSVPILGRARYENLYLDCGHGHVGWTMACGSGRFVADLVAGRKPEIDTDGLLYRALRWPGPQSPSTWSGSSATRARWSSAAAPPASGCSA